MTCSEVGLRGTPEEPLLVEVVRDPYGFLHK